MRTILILLLIAVTSGYNPVLAQKKTSTTKKKSTTSQSKTTTKPKSQAASANKKPGASSKDSQDKYKPGMIAANKIDEFKLQVVPLVEFFESSLNFIGDKRNTVNEKQTIISQSYLKWCWDEEVQVEDDLDEKRLVPLYKNMSAYLSDVDFFFRNVKFNYTVQSVNVETNPQGLIYFKVTANRSLQGMTINGDSVNANKVRYIEINFDSVKQQLKIVSIYTTKLNERDDMRQWWNGLSQGWKSILAKDMKLEGTLPMDQIESFNDSVAMVGGQKKSIMGSEFYKFLDQIVHVNSVDLSGNQTISNLEPLSKLSDLTDVNLSGTPVNDLMPLRNLNNLEILNISNTNIDSLQPLRYCLLIEQLRMKDTPITDLSMIPTFQALSILDISGTKVTSLNPLRDMTSITDLRINHTRIHNLGPLASLINLENLNISNTPIDNLDSLRNLTKLLSLYCDSTWVRSLAPLDKLAGLQRVYCNKSPVSQKELLNFMQKHPDASLVYATKDLTAWWNNMTPEWQNQFDFYIKLDNPPTTEQLHKLVLLDSINITGRPLITSLAPLSKLILLRNLQCPSTGITSLDPLKNLTNLEVINASITAIDSLQPLWGMENLEVININRTDVNDLSPLFGMKKLKYVYADKTKLDRFDGSAFADKNPDCILVFQTGKILDLWNKLSPAWQKALLQQIKIQGAPDEVQLHQIAGLTRVVISENSGIIDLDPLKKLLRLTELEFSGTAVTKLDPLNKMTKLKKLRCPKNPITDLSPISSLNNLIELDFSDTQVEDIDALQNLRNLKILKFSGTRVKNLKYLEKLVDLEEIEFSTTRVSSIDVLDGMTKLKSVKMFNTKVSAKRVDKLRAILPNCEIVFY